MTSKTSTLTTVITPSLETFSLPRTPLEVATVVVAEEADALERLSRSSLSSSLAFRRCWTDKTAMLPIKALIVRRCILKALKNSSNRSKSRRQWVMEHHQSWGKRSEFSRSTRVKKQPMRIQTPPFISIVTIPTTLQWRKSTCHLRKTRSHLHQRSQVLRKKSWRTQKITMTKKTMMKKKASTKTETPSLTVSTDSLSKGKRSTFLATMVSFVQKKRAKSLQPRGKAYSQPSLRKSSPRKSWCDTLPLLRTGFSACSRRQSKSGTTGVTSALKT